MTTMPHSPEVRGATALELNYAPFEGASTVQTGMIKLHLEWIDLNTFISPIFTMQESRIGNLSLGAYVAAGDLDRGIPDLLR